MIVQNCGVIISTLDNVKMSGAWNAPKSRLKYRQIMTTHVTI